MSFKPISQHDVVRHLVHDTGFIVHTSDAVQRDIIIAEYLRASLFELSTTGDRDTEQISPVYVRRLTHAVCRHLGAVWSDLQLSRNKLPLSSDESETESLVYDHVKLVLERLAILGDCVHIGKGYWLPTPIRLVSLPNETEIAVIGAYATRHLRKILPKVKMVGYGRIISKKDVPDNVEEFGIDSQFYKDWVGWCPDNLDSWTQEELRRVPAEGNRSSSTFLDFEVYVLSNTLRTGKRWNPAHMLVESKVLEKVMLCRTKQPRRYFLGEFVNGHLVRERAVEQSSVRWLLLGLHQLQGSLPTAGWNDEFLHIYPALPSALERHITLYACKVKKDNKSSYYVPFPFKGRVEEFLQQQGYVLRNKGGNSK